MDLLPKGPSQLWPGVPLVVLEELRGDVPVPVLDAGVSLEPAEGDPGTVRHHGCAAVPAHGGPRSL